MIKTRKKAQVFTIDYVVGLLIFIFLVIVGVKLLLSINTSESYETLNRDSNHLSEQLINPGYPQDWNSSNVILLGVTDNQRLNTTKLQRFDELDYEKTKTLFHITTEYIFFFKNGTNILNLSKCVRGYNLTVNSTCEPDLTNIMYENLIKTERIMIYNSSITKMIIYSWN